MRKRGIFVAPLALLGFLLFIALGGAAVMQLWNWLFPAIFGWTPITFWQALGLLALCRILVGGFGFHRHDPRGFRGRHWRGRHWTNERWESLTPEEKERFRERMHKRWGHWPYGPEFRGPWWKDDGTAETRKA